MCIGTGKKREKPVCGIPRIYRAKTTATFQLRISPTTLRPNQSVIEAFGSFIDSADGSVMMNGRTRGGQKLLHKPARVILSVAFILLLLAFLKREFAQFDRLRVY